MATSGVAPSSTIALLVAAASCTAAGAYAAFLCWTPKHVLTTHLTSQTFVCADAIGDMEYVAAGESSC